MKAIRCKDHKACLHHVDAPTGEGVRIKVAAAGICGSDLHMLAMGFPIPFTLGHEIAGVTPNGTPVAIEPMAYCGHCEYCARGDYNLCMRGSQMVIGVGSDGGMAEELIVPEHCLVPLPASVRVQDACLVEPLSVAVHGLARVAIGHKDRIAVVGGGTIGLCAVAIATLASNHVDLVARHAAQKEAGEKLGAKLNVTGDYDLVIDCAGTSESIAQAVGLCKPGATLLLLATYWGGLTLPAFEVTMKQLKIVTSSSQARSGLTRDVDIAASAMARSPAIASTLITHRFPLEAVEEAFAIANNRAAGAIKVAFNP
jgi:threonine dehydrogenase-like Zn-dependent dehydrogenase